ncbi:MAG TPA: LapA family protein, partial [Burkholderiaceae bacterium]|nr:LapA family protein [Burkholderiaceae bacterium]
RSLLFLLVFGALAAFVLVNWPVLNDPTTLSLAFAEVQAPLGVVMLGFIVIVTVLFLAYIVYLQMSGLLETRRHGKEIQSQRLLADQAEASRFTELRSFLEAEFARQATRQAERDAAHQARLDALEQRLKVSIEQQANSLSASVGELGDRVGHQRPREP